MTLETSYGDVGLTGTPNSVEVIIINSVLLFLMILVIIYNLICKKKLSTGKFINIQTLIVFYFCIEFLFIMSIIDLDFYSIGFRLTLLAHSLIEALLSFYILFDEKTANQLSYWLISGWILMSYIGLLLFKPISILIIGAIVLPCDILTFVAGSCLYYRSNSVSVRRYGLFWIGHMLAAFVIFGLFLFQLNSGWAWLINALYQIIYAFLLMPFASMSDEEMIKNGFLPKSNNNNNNNNNNNDDIQQQVHTLQITENNDNHNNNNNNVIFKNYANIFNPKKLMNIKYTFIIVLTIGSVFFLLATGIALGIKRFQFIDIVTNNEHYYYPGRIDGVLPN